MGRTSLHAFEHHKHSPRYVSVNPAVFCQKRADGPRSDLFSAICLSSSRKLSASGTVSFPPVSRPLMPNVSPRSDFVVIRAMAMELSSINKELGKSNKDGSALPLAIWDYITCLSACSWSKCARPLNRSFECEGELLHLHAGTSYNCLRVADQSLFVFKNEW